MLNLIHQRAIFPRRIKILSQLICEEMPQHATVLDVGCGSGELAQSIMHKRPDLEISGLEVRVRPQTFIPVVTYDGQHLPFEDQSFDVVMFIDVLHHTNCALNLLAEARRVARQLIIIKDHLCEGAWDQRILRWMDRVGNDRFDVPSPGNYWSREQWLRCFQELTLKPQLFKDSLKLYPFPLDFIFGGKLHLFTALNLKSAVKEFKNGAEI